ncbi:hypothetical protein HNR38_000693 [Marinobacter oulmenensis]|uniref:Uncharacterized protein n=1 Tax=Marinobacter oulmenensis TaxID=643747 RepID=A0A840UBZ0_9GAMM|nr:hypothetical protein [Marinobacter oulmenensis]
MNVRNPGCRTKLFVQGDRELRVLLPSVLR